jgi:hypothetical protein
MIKVDKAFRLEYLLNSEASNMNVDGSSDNKTFKYEIPAGECWFLKCASVFLLDDGTMAHNSFGSIAELTNGLDFIIRKDGADFKIKEIKNNLDLMFSFPRNTMVGNSGTGFLNEDDYFFGARTFDDDESHMMLCGDDGDKIKIVVKDDLTAIEVLKASVTLWKAL